MKLDYSKLQTASADPDAASMIETFRSIGYTLETAVADIIDNSITAGAKNIWITREWKGSESTICIKDDGCGMSSNEALQAMKPGAKNPLMQRDSADLGRFGLGLKTASFSQCRRLTLLSHKSGYAEISWTWDMDYVEKVNKWDVIKWMPEFYKEELKDVKTGTCVIWSEMDRIVPPGTDEENEEARQKFNDALARVYDHIAMTFHRFMEDGDIRIWWGENQIAPWDPFCLEEEKTQPVPVEDIDCNDEIVRIQGYVLPHKDDFSSESAYRKAEGSHGYPAQQGFYVYRGKRLLLAGDWLGLFRKEEHYKLVRILIDLPNTLDSHWQINVMKSTAIPPQNCREFLRSYAKKVRAIGVEVFRHKGKIIKHRAGAKFQTLWNEKKVGNKIFFVVNRQHAFVTYLKLMAKDNSDKAIEMLLNFVEESIPTKSIFIKESEGQEDDSQTEVITTHQEKNLRIVAEGMYKQMRKDGTPEETVKAQLLNIEPFNNYQYIIEELHD